MDITYVPMACGFVYLAAVVDRFSRRVVAWWVSISMDTSFCIAAAKEARMLHGKPAIFNPDQGNQFISMAFTDVLGRIADHPKKQIEQLLRWAYKA